MNGNGSKRIIKNYFFPTEEFSHRKIKFLKTSTQIVVDI